MKRWTWAVIGAAIIIGGIALYLSQQKKEPDVIKIGAILPLTGKVALFGNWIKNGLELALEDIQTKDSSITIEILYEDHKMDAKSSVLALNKLIKTNKVNFVISAMSKTSIPLIPIIAKHNIPLLLVDVTYPNVTNKSLCVFRHFIQSDREAKVLARFAINELDLDTISILAVNDEAGNAASKSFETTFGKLGGTVKRTEFYESGDLDLKGIISILKKSPAIYIFGNGPSWAMVLRQLKELGYEGVILTNTAMYIEPFRKLAGKNVIEGIYFTYPYIDTTISSVRYFVNKYKRKYKDFPPIEAAYAWDVIHWIYQGFKHCKKNGECNLCEALTLVDTLSGAFGTIKIADGKRDLTTPIAIGKIVNGSIKTLKIYTKEVK